jgi:hypothetical protein
MIGNSPNQNKAARSGRLEVGYKATEKRPSYIGPQAVVHWQSGGQ